jgi:hypothetical protein
MAKLKNPVGWIPDCDTKPGSNKWVLMTAITTARDQRLNVPSENPKSFKSVTCIMKQLNITQPLKTVLKGPFKQNLFR